MNDSYEQYHIIRGKRYRYDPDYDCYYRAHTPEEEFQMSRETLISFGITTLILGGIVVWGFLTGRFHW